MVGASSPLQNQGSMSTHSNHLTGSMYTETEPCRSVSASYRTFPIQITATTVHKIAISLNIFSTGNLSLDVPDSLAQILYTVLKVSPP